MRKWGNGILKKKLWFLMLEFLRENYILGVDKKVIFVVCFWIFFFNEVIVFVEY